MFTLPYSLMIFKRSLHEAIKERVRTIRARLELWVKLTGDEKRMIRRFNHFYQLAIWRYAAGRNAPCGVIFAVRVIALKAMAMTLRNFGRAVKLGRSTIGV